MNESINVQSQALFLTALYTGYRAVETGGKAFFGSNSTSSRSDLWKSASKQETYLSALSNRCQVIVGSDSLYSRVTNLAKSIGFGLSTMVSLSLLGIISENKGNLDEINNQLAQCQGDAAAKAGLEIEKAGVENQLSNCTELLEVCQPQLQKFTNIFESAQEALAQSAQLTIFKNIFPTTTDAEACKRNSVQCNIDKLALRDQLTDCNVNLLSNATALAKLNQQHALDDTQASSELARYQKIYPTVDEAQKGVAFYDDCSKLLQEKSSNITAIQRQLTACNTEKGTVEGQLTACNTEKGTVEGQLTACNTEKGTVEGQLTACNTEKGTVEEQLTACNTEKGTVEGQLTACTTEKGNVEGQLTACTTEKGNVEGQLTACTTEKGNVEGQLTACTTEKDNVEGQLTACTTEKGNVQGQLETCNAKAKPQE